MANVSSFYSVRDNLEEKRVSALGDEVNGGRWEGAGAEWRRRGRVDGRSFGPAGAETGKVSLPFLPQPEGDD